MVYATIYIYAVFGWQGVWGPTDDVPHMHLFLFATITSLATVALVVPISNHFPKIKKAFGI